MGVPLFPITTTVNGRLDPFIYRPGSQGASLRAIIAESRIEAVTQSAGLEEGQYTVSGSVKGSELEKLRYDHPFVEDNPTDSDAHFAINAEYVTTEDGTGIVHIAPGHGADVSGPIAARVLGVLLSDRGQRADAGAE